MKQRSVMLALITLGITLGFAGLVPVQAAVPEQCIQHKNRVKACPHLLYRVDKLPSQSNGQMICICVTDFSPLLLQPANEQQKIEQNMTRRQFEAEFGADLAVILAILQRQR